MTGGDVSPPGDQLSAEDREMGALKLAMATAYQAVKEGRSSAAGFERAVRAFADRVGLTTEAIDNLLALVKPGFKGRKVTLQQRYLALPHYQQENTYFCGPAVGVMMMATLGKNTSAKNGNSLTQSHMGNSTHMQTTDNGVTSFDSGLFRVGINRWYQGTNTGTWVQHSAPTTAVFKKALEVDIDSFTPFAASTVEFNSGAHYNNHPVIGQAIGHWLAVYGYNGYGATSYFADPATYWTGVQPKFSYDTSSFVNTFLQSNGIAY